jgi:hypothetical protein
VEVEIYSFFNLSARLGWVLKATPRPLYPKERNPVPILKAFVWAPVPIWTGAENFVPIEIRSPDRPFRSDSLYGLR